jgi:hypothetical protein
VEAVAGHDIGFEAEDGADPVLDQHQHDQAEPRIIVVEEQVDVAPTVRFVAGSRAEQIERGDALGAKLIGMSGRRA